MPRSRGSRAARLGRWGTVLATSLSLTALGTPALAAATGPSPAGGPPRPLHQLFDNRAVSEDADPAGADFDGSGNSLSSGALRAAGWTPGRVLGLDAARLTWPHSAPGRPDNVRADGQSVRLTGGGAITFLVAATGGEASGTGVIRYRDGSRSTYTLTAPDWREGPAATRALTLPRVNTPDGPLAAKARLYAVTVPAARGRAVSSLTLPRDPGPRTDLHVFAVSARTPDTDWTGSWSRAVGGYTEVGPWTDRTLRLVVHAGAGGPRVRVRLDNTFADRPVRIGAASVALQRDGAEPQGAPVPLTFGGHRGTEIPAGTQQWSDPLPFPVSGGTNLLVSFHLPETVTAAPVHSKALQRSYLSAQHSGDRTGDTDAGAWTGSLTTYPFLTGVDVGGGAGSVVTLGDSITDGNHSTEDANRRWPDVLAERLRQQAEVDRYGVLNQGLSANRIVTDRYPGEGVDTDTAGTSAQHRLERDVFAQTNVRALLVFEGINDVRWKTPPEEVVDGLRAIAERSRARGVRTVAMTLTPCGGYPDCTPEVEARRTAVNTYLREHGTRADGGPFDALVDADRALADPEHPERMLPAYDSGDGLHPGDAGLRALAEAVDLRLLAGGGHR
ncbi:SGNH/GDSL hydrolase family protein [Streptomyces zingiberis]|uniref:SGNH/GDSL hydrolase family protein n=1 Tax=Streptomyces zingiberis TaxID=2053010 RepID=A0ABX1C2I3_9ACTN|nr:SGNH/GDSL hydrolase family protein [Streptomyces zingiberis]NJQ02818.1 SGNH/GDSL hydrolase family protein [Streptomyces zingiberis]